MPCVAYSFAAAWVNPRTANLVALHGDMETVVCLMCGHREARPHFDARLAAANPGYLERIRLDPRAVNPDGDVELSEQQIAGFRMVGCPVCGSVRLKPDAPLLRINLAHALIETNDMLEAHPALQRRFAHHFWGLVNTLVLWARPRINADVRLEFESRYRDLISRMDLEVFSKMRVEQSPRIASRFVRDLIGSV